jgi:hypothetical protein
MSQRERQASAGTATVALPKNGPCAVATPRPLVSYDSTAPVVSQWELLCHGATSAQQADLLALARQQGVLYAAQLPPLSIPRPTQAAEVPPALDVVGKFLSGQIHNLEPVRPAPVAVMDESLDDNQRLAVAAALATPDMCLIQGAPGTGKSRVLAEIITQAARRGDRILFLAAHPAGLDRVLEQVAARPEVCPLRLLASDESAARLAPAIRGLTLAERSASVRQNTLRTARETRDAAEMQCARRRHEEPLWGRLEELARKLAGDRADLTGVHAKLGEVENEVPRLIQSGDSNCYAAIKSRALRKACEEKSAQLDAEAVEAEKLRVAHSDKVLQLDQQLAIVEPMADAKSRGRWWSPQWWKGTFKGNVVSQRASMRASRNESQAASEEAARQLQSRRDAKQALMARTEADVQLCLQNEMDSRRKQLELALANLSGEIQRQETLWADLSRQIDPEALRPKGQSPQAVCAAREQWLGQRKDDESRCNVAREWASFLDASADTLADRLPGYANLVAAIPAALAGDRHFSDAAASGGQFDLVIMDDAELLTESEFIKLARRARQWVLAGLPTLGADTRPSESSRSVAPKGANGGRGLCFHKLWERLSNDPNGVPSCWFRERDRLGCRLKHISPEQRCFLESEPLADAPDVELRILALPRTRPVLAEVMFPGDLPVPAAKDFLLQELQEVPVEPVDLGRAVCLQRCHRMAPALEAIVQDLLGLEPAEARQASPSEFAQPAVEFNAVGVNKNKNGGRSDPRGPRRQDANALTAGLETDLSATRPGDRLPPELRALATPRGVVNLTEARAVVRKLEEIVAGNGSSFTTAVLALYPAQAELIRNLVQQSMHLGTRANSIVIGTPCALRQREVDVVVLSLTRSHSNKAVSYGESPATLVQAFTRARRKIILVGDPANLIRRAQWNGTVDSLDASLAAWEGQFLGRLARYLQGQGRYASAFRLFEGSLA